MSPVGWVEPKSCAWISPTLGFTGGYEPQSFGETQQSAARLVEADPFNPTYAELSNRG
jgi:hypothetical protein